MTNYEELGFMAGLEIHQQLEGKKLFCNCPTVISEEEPVFSVKRKLRASAGESGKIDTAALHETHKQKMFQYNGYQDINCLVELDEEPVSSPNGEAVKTAVITSKLFDMKFVDNVHVMRKVVVDGSNTSGFQRTMLVSLEGKVNDVRIDRLCLEEDSCKIISRTQNLDVYNLSRLGIPLLEITTKPDIKNPQHLQETAAAIGMVLRSTGRVKRGLGTIRQDVNISIKNGNRVEIKGVQNLDLMPLIAENEVKRQLGLTQLATEIDKIWICESSEFVSEPFAKLDNWISKAIKDGKSVAGIAHSLSGVMGKELFPGYRVGTELAGYAKSWGFGGIIHSDEDPKKYGLDSWDILSDLGDHFILAVGDGEKVKEMFETLLIPRIKQLGMGVPSEVRKANEDGTTTYLRPMPGAARMYPETDVRTFNLDLDVDLPELIKDRIPRLVKDYSISQDLATQLCRLGSADLFETWAKKLNPTLVADILVNKEKDLKRRHKVEIDITQIAEEIFSRLENNTITKEAVEDILLAYSKGSINWDSYKPVDESELEDVIREVVKADPDAPMGALMGTAMKKLGGKADGKKVSELIRKVLNDK